MYLKNHANYVKTIPQLTYFLIDAGECRFRDQGNKEIAVAESISKRKVMFPNDTTPFE